MKLISGFTDTANQRIRLVLEDKSKAMLSLVYSPQQTGFFFDLEYAPKVFRLAGARLVTSPNILRQWRNIIPFGVAILCKSTGEPTRQEFIADGTVSMYLLEGDDLDHVEQTYFSR
jgi:hypothetical protein